MVTKSCIVGYSQDDEFVIEHKITDDVYNEIAKIIKANDDSLFYKLPFHVLVKFEIPIVDGLDYFLEKNAE